MLTPSGRSCKYSCLLRTGQKNLQILVVPSLWTLVVALAASCSHSPADFRAIICWGWTSERRSAHSLTDSCIDTKLSP